MAKGFKKFDPKDEAEWFEYNEMKFLIGPYFGTNYKRVVGDTYTYEDATGLTKEGVLFFKGISAKEASKKIYRIYADALVLDWEGVTEEGKVLKFTPNAVYDLLCEYEDFAQFVFASSLDLRKKQLDIEDEIVKN
jgi:hypothetical protein